MDDGGLFSVMTQAFVKATPQERRMFYEWVAELQRAEEELQQQSGCSGEAERPNKWAEFLAGLTRGTVRLIALNEAEGI